MRLRIAVITDDRVFSAGLMALLRDSTFDAIAHEVDDAQALNGYDLALLDGRASRALEICAGLTNAGHQVLFVSAPTDDNWAREAISAGAAGILTKIAPAEDVTAAICVVARGGMWIMRRWLRPHSTTAPIPTTSAAFADLNLSRREQEVLYQAVMGAGNKVVASRLGITEATVKVHLTHIFQKLHVSGRSELLATCHRLLRASDDTRKRLA